MGFQCIIREKIAYIRENTRKKRYYRVQDLYHSTHHYIHKYFCHNNYNSKGNCGIYRQPIIVTIINTVVESAIRDVHTWFRFPFFEIKVPL